MKKVKILVTGSEGLIGKTLCEFLEKESPNTVIRADYQLGHDLTDERFVNEWFTTNKDLYGLIVCHAFNPLPLKNTKKILQSKTMFVLKDVILEA